MAILKLLQNTSNIFHTDRFSGLTEEARSGYTVVLMQVAERTDCQLTDMNMSLREAVWPGCADCAEATSCESLCSRQTQVIHLSPWRGSPEHWTFLVPSVLTGKYNGSQLPTLSQCWDSVWSEPVLSQSHVHGSCCAWKMRLPWCPLPPLDLTVFLPPVQNRSLHPEGRGLTTIIKYR